MFRWQKSMWEIVYALRFIGDRVSVGSAAFSSSFPECLLDSRLFLCYPPVITQRMILALHTTSMLCINYHHRRHCSEWRESNCWLQCVDKWQTVGSKIQMNTTLMGIRKGRGCYNLIINQGGKGNQYQKISMNQGKGKENSVYSSRGQGERTHCRDNHSKLK